MKGFKRVWKTFDDEVLKNYFGGSTAVTSAAANQHLGNFELGNYSYEVGSQHSEFDDSMHGLSNEDTNMNGQH